MGFGGSFAAFQVATKALCVFGIPGAVAGGALGLIGGCVVGGVAGGLPFATAEALFRKYAEKFKVLDQTLTKIDGVLLENFEVLTEICRLLDKLKKVTKGLSEAPEIQSNVTTQDQVDEKDPLADDDANIDFLIRLRFDSFKQASEELERSCDYLLDDMPLKALSLLSLKDASDDHGKVTKETKKSN